MGIESIVVVDVIIVVIESCIEDILLVMNGLILVFGKVVIEIMFFGGLFEFIISLIFLDCFERVNVVFKVLKRVKFVVFRFFVK